MKINYSSH